MLIIIITNIYYLDMKITITSKELVICTATGLLMMNLLASSSVISLKALMTFNDTNASGSDTIDLNFFMRS